MTRVVATHAVGDMETWLGGGETRADFFKNFSSSYRVFRHAEKDQLSIVFEDVDLEKMQTVLGTPEVAEAKAAHTVIDPVEVYIEVEGGG